MKMEDFPSVFSEVLNALECNDIQVFEKLLEDLDVEDLEKRHEYGYNSTYLEIACNNGQSDFLKLLVEKGAEVNSYNPKRRTFALHTACKKGHYECVKILLKNGANVNAQDGHGGQTPLHVLLSVWKESSETPTLMFPFDPVSTIGNTKFARCFQLLVDTRDIDLNIKNNKTYTPLEVAVEKQNTFAIKILLDHGASFTDRTRHAIIEIQESTPYLQSIKQILIQKSGEDVVDGGSNLEDRIREAIQRNDHKLMQRLLQIPEFHMLDNDLQLKLSISLFPGFQLPLRSDNLPQPTISSSDPLPPYGHSIILAAWRGSDSILKLLVEDPRCNVNVYSYFNQTALHIVTSRLKTNPVQYTKCLQVLLSANKISVDPTDYLGNSPLHYAGQTGVEDAILALLHKGANVCLKNKARKTPLEYILPNTVEKFFNECVTSKKDEQNCASHRITFDYKFLANTAPSALVSGNENNEVVAKATLIKDAEVKVSFQNEIELKETRKSSKPSNINHFYPESRALRHLARSPRHQNLVRHPLVSSFLLLKWQKVRRYFYFNWLLYLLSLVCLTSYVLIGQSNFEVNSPLMTYRDAVWYILLVLTSLHTVREFLQFAFSPLFYISCLENYLQLGMTVSTILMLFVAHYESAPLAVLCAYGAFFIAVGRFPENAIRVTMLITVAINFMKHLLWYSVLIMGFGLSLHITFKRPLTLKTRQVPSNITFETTTDKHGFETYEGTFLKMLAMMIGELELLDLPFDVSPMTSRLVCVGFVFLITIVLFNLLGGLAVSDIQAIQSQAEIVSNQSLIDLIYSLELLSFNHPSYCLSHCSLIRWLRRLSGDQHCHCLRISSLPRCLSWSSMQVLGECLPYNCFTVFVNADGHPNEDVIGTPECKCHKTFTVPRKIIETACELTQEPKKCQESIAGELAKLDNRMKILQQTVKMYQKQVLLLRRK